MTMPRPRHRNFPKGKNRILRKTELSPEGGRKSEKGTRKTSIFRIVIKEKVCYNVIIYYYEKVWENP